MELLEEDHLAILGAASARLVSLLFRCVSGLVPFSSLPLEADHFSCALLLPFSSRWAASIVVEETRNRWIQSVSPGSFCSILFH